MIVIYIGALVAALGSVALQLFAGHDAGGGGHDTDGHGADHDAGPWTLLASVRFWSFLLLAFGLVGTLLSVFQLAGAGATFAVALLAGALSGVFAVTVIRRLLHKSASSNVQSSDIVGRLGRVIVPLASGGRGKVRVEVRGSVVDYVARAGDEIAEGDAVIVEECEGGEVVVSRAPPELKLKA